MVGDGEGRKEGSGAGIEEKEGAKREGKRKGRDLGSVEMGWG